MPTKKLSSPAHQLPVPIELVERRIYLIRGQKVMFDSDLADLYEVETKVLNQAVKRNLERFPQEFMFRLTLEEAKNLIGLRSQIVTLKRGQHLKYAPYAFTEQGVAMLSSVLRSKRAIQVNIAIMKAFVRLREVLATHKDLARKVEAHDDQIKHIWKVIKHLLEPAYSSRPKFGFRTEGKK